MDQAIYAYPWDLIDDARAGEYLGDLGMGTVSLAAVYHSIRAVMPHNPRRKLLHAEHAAVYFAPDGPRYRGARLQPPRPSWTATDDAFGSALHRLRQADQRVNAWVVLTHASIHGRAHPDLTVVNAFGDRYEHALCPAHPEVREYARRLVTDLVDNYDVDGVELEAWGYMGVDHGSHHDKVGIVLDALHRFLFSICFNSASQKAIDRAGGDPERIRNQTQRQLTAFFGSLVEPDHDGARVLERLEECLGHADAAALLAAREAVTLSLLDEILAALPAPSPEIYVFASPQLHMTGAAVGVRPETLQGRVSGAIRPMFGQSPASAGELIAGFVDGAGQHLKAIATLPLFGPGISSRDDLEHLADAVLDSGAAGVRYYHYGLATEERLGWAADLARVIRGHAGSGVAQRRPHDS